MPAPTKQTITLKTALTDITIALAAVATVGEGVLATLPNGAVTTTLKVAFPALVALVAGLKKILGR